MGGYSPKMRQDPAFADETEAERLARGRAEVAEEKRRQTRLNMPWDIKSETRRVRAERGEFEAAAKRAGRPLTPPPDETAAYLQMLSRMSIDREMRQSSLGRRRL